MFPPAQGATSPQAAQADSEIELADQLPVAEERYRKWRIARHVPVVERGPPHQFVTARLQVGMLCKVVDVVLDQDQSRPVAFERETTQHRKLLAFHVDREEVHPIDAA